MAIGHSLGLKKNWSFYLENWHNGGNKNIQEEKLSLAIIGGSWRKNRECDADMECDEFPEKNLFPSRNI